MKYLQEYSVKTLYGGYGAVVHPTRHNYPKTLNEA